MRAHDRARVAPIALASVCALLAAGCLGGPPGDGAPSPPTPTGTAPRVDLATVAIRLEPAFAGLTQPLFLTHAGDGSGRVFVVEQGGVVRVARGGSLMEDPFLDVSSLVTAGGERGLLGLAFAPDFEESGRVYVDYTDANGDTVVARYVVERGLGADRVDPSSAEVLLRVVQPFANHNGGHVAFGPDGFLYVALGDGGSGGDPGNRAQDRGELLGKILRVDVAGARATAPSSNPFVGRDGADEVWALGLRNPWRFSFDRESGDLWIGDVGQGDAEEINFEAAGGSGGRNYGWNVWEGSKRFRPGSTNGDATFPVAEYSQDGGHCAVTGGYVYRGNAVPALRGVYLYADYCSGTVWGLAPDRGEWVTRTLLTTEHRISSFGEDEAGELYVVDHTGRVMRVAREA